MTISFSGLASGLDTSSWVESLVKLKQAKIDTLKEEKEGIELTKDTLESIKSFFSSFRSVLEKVTDSKFGIAATDLFAQNLATSANLDVLTATATTEAEESTYNVLVDQLATNSAAKSNYSYMTTIIQTTTATADSKLINLGVKTGNIGVKVNGIERGIEIKDSDTISSFIEKLQNIGVNASFNDKTGIFSMDISANDINDIDKTGIVNAFKLSGVNEGYTSNSLKITSTDTIYSAATNDTKLSELGAKAGTLIIKANDTEYRITIDENTTLGEFIKKLNDNKINANLDKTGILTIVDANITNEGTTNIKNALGLELDIYSNTQKSNDLSHKTIITQTTTATSDTLLKDLGGEIKDNQTVIVKNSNNEYSTITVGTSTTLGDLLTKISNAGLYAAIDTEGRVEISGGTITGGTFNAIKALGLTSEPYSAITTGKPLTETVRKAELVTLETKLVDEMKVRAGYIEVTDNDGNKFYEKIYHGQTIADFMSDMGNLGIYTKLRDDGVLEITGGAFATLSDDKVKELIANGTIRETDDRYKQGTDLLTCLYGSPVISTDQITVASTYSKSRALTKKVVNTIAASLTSTLGNLSLQADGTAIFDVRGDKRTIEVAKTDTLQNLMDKLKNVGIASSWNSNTQQFTIENATLEGGTANLGSVLNLTKTISGKYVTSNSLNKLETVTIDATRSTTLNKYGISNSMSDANRTVKLFDNNAKLVGSLTVTESTTIGDVLDFVNKNSGMKASIVDGILQIEGGYIENAALEKAMGLTTENKSSFALGSIMTVTTVAAVTGSTTLGQIISTLGTADAVKDGYSLTFNSKSLSVSATTTLDQLISQIFTNGGSASLDNTGRLSISGGVVAGSVATALGITTVSTTTAVSATGKTLVTTKTEYADLETKLSDVGVSDNSTIILNNKEGSAYKTITVNGSTTVKDVFASLKAEGIDGTISNGVISLKSAEYKYITGTVATALGIGTQTVTDVVNTSVYSTSKVTFTGSGLADGTTAIGSIIGVTADNNKLTIKDKNNNTIGTVTVTNTTTLDELFGMLAKFDITGKVSDGVISFDSPSGNYVQGGLVNSWGMTASTVIVTTTVGKTSTSTAAISHTVTKTADISSTLAQLGINKGNTLIVHKTDGGTATVTVSGSTTLDSLFDSLDNHGVQGVVAEGIITFTSVDGAYLTDASGSDLLSKLGVTTVTKTVTTTTTKGTTMTSGSLTYTGTESATLANKVLSYTTLTTNQTVTVKDSDGNTKGSVTVTANTTFSDLFKALDDLGIQGTMEDGMVTLTSNNGFYATGGVLTALGIEAKTMLTTITVGTTNTSTAAVTYTDTFVATEDTLVGSCIDLSTGNTLVVNSGQKKALTTITVSATTTFKDLMNTLKENGIDSTFINGVLSLKSEDGNYVTGDVADKLGISLIKFIGMGVSTGGGSGSSTIEGGSTVDTALIGQLAYFLGNTTTINIKSSDGTVIATQEFYGYAKIDDLIRFFTKYGISAEVRDNILCLDNNEGIYAEDAATGGFLTQIGVGVTTKAVATSFLSVITSTTASNAIAISSITSLVVGSTYSISSASDLIKLATLVNSGQSTTGATFILTNDIDWANTPGYTPIGDGKEFQGVFYGNGHVIKNLSISADGTAGLFGKLGSTARIIDLGVENAYVYSSNGHAGVIAGNAEGTITNCFVKGNITVKSSAYASAGGLVGRTTNTISNCYTSGNIYIYAKSQSSANDNGVGGLIGYSSSTINNCFVQGNIQVDGDANIGGFAGYITGNATGVTVKGTVNASGTYDVGGYFGKAKNVSNIVADFAGSVKGQSKVGGIVGEASVVSNCTASINVIGKNDSAVDEGLFGASSGRIGGIVGSVSSISQCSYNGTITLDGTVCNGGIAGTANSINNCYSSGLITGAGAVIGGIAGSIINATTSASSMTINMNGTYKREKDEYDFSTSSHHTYTVNVTSTYVGGFAGISYNNISNCYATGNVTTKGTTILDNGSFIGGFIGYVNTSNATIQNCYATGNISAETDSLNGGFIGQIYANLGTVKVTNCYATGDVNDSANSDSTSSAAFVGRLDTLNSGKIEISQAYASGVAKSGQAFGGKYVVNSDSVTISATYGNSANTSTLENGKTNCTKLTTSQLQNQATMTSYGFTTAKGWSYETGKTPMLKYTAGKTSTTNEQKYTYASIRLPVNTNSKNLQEIIDNGIAGGNDDGGVAVGNDILGNVISFPEKYLTINIKSSDGSIIKSLSFNQYSRISELLKFFNDNGINSYMKDGVLYLNNDNGIYAEDAIAGGVLSQMKISTTTKSVATSFLSVITSTTASNAIAISSITSLVVGSTYSISSASDLIKLATLVNSGQSTTGATFILTNDIDWANTPGYTPIGDGKEFQGVFYGNGHVIKNLSISADGTAGLFGKLGSTARIIDLGVENAYVYSSNGHAGVIAGNAEGTITNCFVKGNITVKSSAYASAGGLVGRTTNTISNCYTSGNIYIYAKSQSSANDNGVGGLIGYSSSTINNCFVQGNIQVDGDANIGGFAGYITGNATGVTVKGTVNASGTYDVGGYFGKAKNVSNIVADFAGSVKGQSKVGGIVGEASVVSNCTASINVIGKNDSAVDEGLFGASSGRIGGIVGSVSSISQCSYNGTITLDGTVCNGGIAGTANSINNCYSSGLITGAGAVIGGIAGSIINATTSASSMTINMNGTYKREKDEYDFSTSSHHTYTVNVTSTYVGGFAGISYNNISNCYATGNVTTKGTTILDNGSFIGGFIGYVNTSNATIQNCYATGNISAETDSLNGGFIGQIYANLGTVKVTNCYATGDVNDSANSDSTSSAAFVGRLDTLNSGKIEISQAYASGVAKSGQAFGGKYVVNSDSVTISATYGNSANTSTLENGKTNCTKLTTSQLQNQATMTSYGFTTAKGWSYETGKTPMLKYTAGKTSTTNEQKYTYASIRLPVNTNSMILYRTYTPGSGGSGGGGGGGSVVVTILTNSTSDQQSYKSLTQMTTETLFKMLGFSDSATGYITVVSGGTQHVVTIKSSDTIDDILTTLAGFSVSGSVHDGKLTLTGTSNGYIAGASDDVKTALKIETGSGKTYTTSTKTSGFNTVSNKLSKSVTYKADGDTLLSKINKTGTISGVYKGQAFSVTASAGKTIGDVLTELAGYGISGSIENGVIKLVGTPEGYITDAGGAFGLTGSAYSTTTTSKVSGVNSNSNKQVYSSTVSINPTSTFSQLGMSANGTMVINNNGKLYTVTAKTTDTLDSLLTTIAGLGIAGSIADGKLTLAGTADGFISSMSDNLKTALKLNIGSGNSYSTSTKTICSQGTSGNLGYVSTNAALTSSTKLSNINGFANGNGKLVIHQTNGQFVTISIDATKTLGEFFTDISRYGLVGNINDGKVSIEGIGNVYMQATDGGSNILTALKLSNVIQNVQTVTVNRTSNILSHTITVAASGTTQLGNLADSLGNTIGSGNGTIVLSTTSNAGNQNVTLTFDRTKSIYDVIDALAGYGINASLDALGKFSINSSTLTDFSISGNLGTLLMGTYTKVYGKGETFNISTNLVEKTTLPMSKTDLLSSFGITNGNILVTQQGVNYTVNINTTQVKTVADFMKLLSSYGFESDIDSAGRLYVSGVGKSYLSSISGGSNILDKFGLTNWSLGDVKQESKHLGDYKVNNITCSLDTKLNQLTDASGSNLGISSGNIYVYQDGTRYLVNIDNNDTLQTLSAKLAQYGITMGLSTEGKLYFDGTNDSYMTTDGITNGASNILNRLNIAGNWSTRYDSTSENLSYTTKSNNIVSGSTKLADLQDSDGKNLGITTGAFYVYNSGSRSTESITADMTVNDLMATLAKHGLVADIAEDGSISIGAYNNTYLATSALTSDNSNIVSKLFSEWNFVNIYTSKGLDIPVDEVRSINRNTKLSAINEGKYQDGYITVVKDGVQTNIKLTSDDTVGTLMDELSLYGFESVINEKGQLLIKNTGNSLLQKYTGTEQASNALELLGIDLNNWIQTSSYKSDTLKVTQTSTIDSDVTRDTLLSELGVTTGEYNIFKNGVKYTAYISTGETMGSFLDTLKSFGIETSLVSDGDSSILTIIGSGDTYIAKSNSTTGASNVVEKLFANNDKYSSFRYKGLEQTSETVTHFTAATKDTLLSEFNKKDGSNTLTSVGDLSVTVNGETATIKIEADETFGSLIEKFKALGLEASISSTGQLMIQSGYNTFTINSDGTNSNLLSNVGLVYHKDLGGYVASTDTLKATTTTIEEKTFSVANYADYNTKMSLMNISSGTLSVYLNGQKATIKIDKNQTFGDLRSLVSTEFADVDLTFEDGYIKFYSKKDGDKVEVGATTDTSNFAAITGITSDGNGAVKSARELFCVNNSSVITNSGLFRKGDVTKGTFTVGNATFTIDDKTTISDIISQINSNDEANATAYWDSIEGNFVIKSRTTGSALINIEAGTSNFTDIMGFTNSEWAADGSLNVTRMNTASQEVGNNAKFSINGTYYTSTSNNITSDVSRIKGLTINLKGLTDGSAITLTVERDKETLANAVSDIVDSYNELMDNVDKEITKEGKLKDQSTLKLIRNQLRSLMTSSDAGTTIFRNLDAIGIKVEAASGNNISTSGLTTLTFDKDKFFEAFKSDQNAVKDLLIGSANNTGIFTKVENLVESSLKSVSGYFESADKSYQKQINKLDNKIEKQKTALERYRAQLESKFSSMDILIANMQQQYSSFLRT